MIEYVIIGLLAVLIALSVIGLIVVLKKKSGGDDACPKSWTLLSLGFSQFVNADAARYLAGGIHFVFDLILLLL